MKEVRFSVSIINDNYSYKLSIVKEQLSEEPPNAFFPNTIVAKLFKSIFGI